MGDVMFNPITTPFPTRLGPRQWDTDSIIDSALASPRISPWLSAETLTPHGRDHLPVVFSLQKRAKKQNVKPHYPFRYEVRCRRGVKAAQAKTKNIKYKRLTEKQKAATMMGQ